MAKKIGAIVSLSIIGILIIATIIMANINIDYSVKCLKPDVVYVQTSDGNTLGVSSEQKDKIVELINLTSKEKVLTALFNGNLDKKAELVTEKSTISTPNNFYVRYKYTTKQELNENNSITYEELVFVVNNIEGETEVKVYVIPESENANTYSHYYILSADFEELYSYLNENF